MLFHIHMQFNSLKGNSKNEDLFIFKQVSGGHFAERKRNIRQSNSGEVCPLCASIALR